jgi:hypothetical protein
VAVAVVKDKKMYKVLVEVELEVTELLVMAHPH